MNSLKSLIAIATVAIIQTPCLAGSLVSNTGPRPIPGGVKFEVDADDEKFSTAVDVKSGQFLHISWYAGEWYYDKSGRSCGADGKDGPAPDGYPLARATKGSLLAKIGDSDWFYVGRAWSTLDSPYEGTLYLRCNDARPSDNKGQLVVRVGTTKPSK